MTITTIPAAQGRTTYRLYTVEDLPFDAIPTYRDGGPAKVSMPGWSKSTSSMCPIFSSPSVIAADDRRITLSLRLNGEPHPLDKSTYATQDEADRAAYEVGASAFMVYDRDAAKWGLPTT